MRPFRVNAKSRTSKDLCLILTSTKAISMLARKILSKKFMKPCGHLALKISQKAWLQTTKISAKRFFQRNLLNRQQRLLQLTEFKYTILSARVIMMNCHLSGEILMNPISSNKSIIRKILSNYMVPFGFSSLCW